jgi:hypothetical protein
MDTSEKYILMCIKAQEVQENKNFQTYCNDDFVTVSLSENNKGYCEEIKNKLIIGDFGSIINNHFYGRVANNALGTQFKDLFDIVIWLPRQDQLQEMIKGSIINKINNFNSFIFPPVLTIKTSVDEEALNEFKKEWRGVIASETSIKLFKDETDMNIVNVFTCSLHSFEQLWLAFVMKEKHSKIWNEQKEEWVLDN